jgi:NTP pyrophosphatase (non-canonical NTP hydrolase)
VELTIDEILASLSRRGFYVGLDTERAAVQVFAVAEELGEVARKLRRDAQGVQPIDPVALANEAADVVIAAVCLLGACAGKESARFVHNKMVSDEERGWLHNGAQDNRQAA